MERPDPRETWRDILQGNLLHEPFQRFLNWLSGKPRANDEPLFHWTPWSRLAMGLATTGLGLAIAIAVLAHGGLGLLLLLLPVGWLFTIGGLRALYLEDAHAAVHGVFAASEGLNRVLTEVLTTLTLTNGYDVFERDHLRSHHAHTGSLRDVDYRTLIAWGFRPGMTRSALWRRLWTALFSPRVHGGYLAQRLRTNFGRELPAWRRGMALAFWGVQLALVARFGLWAPWAIAFLLPLTIGYQASSLLQMLGAEHLWGQDLGRGAERIARQTYGRFLGDPYPAAGQGGRARWWLWLFLVHLPARIAVYIGHDLGPAHDLHHRQPRHDWANAPYVRQRLVEADSPGWKIPYQDHWGSLASHIERVFAGWAAMPPLTAEEWREYRRLSR